MMGMELKMLAWAMVLGLVQIGLAATLTTQQRGLGWNAGPRDDNLPPCTGLAGRLERASRNFLETFPFFAAAVLAVVALQAANAGTARGAQLYFWARVVYVPLYALGVPYLRTVVWAASMVGLIMVLRPLLG